jgi:hypothetical protein
MVKKRREVVDIGGIGGDGMQIHAVPGVVLDGRVDLEVYQRQGRCENGAVGGRIVETDCLELPELKAGRPGPERREVVIEVEISAFVPGPADPAGDIVFAGDRLHVRIGIRVRVGEGDA